MNMTVYHPFADDLLRGFFRPVHVEKTPATIKIDVTEQDNAYVVKAEIPGVNKDDIQVSIEGNQVTIGAEVKRESETKEGHRLLRAERYTGSVYRGFTLPVEIDEAASNAKYENGVLELTLTKKAAVAGHKLTIQ
jgi:HSP20 family protein